KWDVTKGLAAYMGSKYLFDSFWPQIYHGLKEIMNNSATRPDMMIADFFVDAVKDIHGADCSGVAQHAFPDDALFLYPRSARLSAIRHSYLGDCIHVATYPERVG